MSLFASLKKGDKVRFVYKGGSVPNRMRAVEVIDVMPNGTLRGTDLDIGQVRCFLPKLSHSLSVQEAPYPVTLETILFSKAQEKIVRALNCDDLCRLYAEFCYKGEDVKVTYDRESASIRVLAKQHPETINLEPNGLVHIQNKHGKTAIFDSVQMSARNLAENILEHLDSE